MPRTTTIGSYPVFPSPTRIRLYESQKKMGKGDSAYDPYLPTIEASVNDFISSGVEILSTGQTRETYRLLFLDPSLISNIQLDGSTVRIMGELARRSPIRLSDLKYAKEAASQRGIQAFKEPITDPFTLATYSQVVKGYTSIKELTMDFLKKLVIPEALDMQPYVEMFQFDAPQYSAVSSLPDYIPQIYEELSSVLDKPIVLHVCGDTAPIFKTLKTFQVDILSLDFRINPKLADEVARNNCDQTIGLGVVDVDPTPAVSETVNDIFMVMENLVKKIGEDRVSLIHPTCGQRNLLQSVAFKRNLSMVMARDQLFYGNVKTVPASSEAILKRDVSFDQHFSVYVDYDSRQIILSMIEILAGGLRQPVLQVKGNSGGKIIDTILSKKLLGEAADARLIAKISYELAKAETSLRSKGLSIYRQDQDLLSLGLFR